MKAIKLLSLSVIMATCLLNYSYSQQEAQFSQYMDNMLYYNPAYAGSRNMMNISALHRQQWAGFKGAPMSTTFSLHTPLRYENIGLGFSLLNDNVGPTNSTWFNLDFSYSLKFKKHNGRLSFGVKGGINLLNGDLMKLTKQDQNDQFVNVQFRNDIQPNVGAGIYYQSTQWFAGFAIPRIIDNLKKAGDFTNIEYIAQRHYYFTVGGYIKTGRMLKIRPSAMLKITEQAPIALDMSLAFIFYDKVWLGANYRLMESAGFMVQYQISNQFKIGYAFDYSTTKLRNYNYGTHELLLSYDLLFKNKSIATPRYF
ncbi:MAG: type IX secretion system membrane protein PorP/SprF [Crocinitomicaceae bacterium]|nr:type IX secretion system membrane protein PorP/SprF [Crocinitomicaceae bacterium]